MKTADLIRKQLTGTRSVKTDMVERRATHIESSPGNRSDPAPEPVPRDAKGRVMAGNRLNPSGRPQGVVSICKGILERARGWDYLEDIVAGLEDVPAQLRTDVTRWLVDRVYGKAVAVSVSSEVTPEQLEGVIDLASLPSDDLVALHRVQRRFAELEAGRQENQEVALMQPVSPAP